MKLIMAMLVSAATAVASPPPPPFYTALLGTGYSVATIADFVGTPGYSRRLHDPRGDLAVSADFNGDGTIDEARVLRNVARGDAYVVATVLTKAKLDTYVVKIMTLDQAATVGIRVAPPLKAGGAAGLTIFSLDGSTSETFDWAEEDFVKRASAQAPRVASTVSAVS